MQTNREAQWSSHHLLELLRTVQPIRVQHETGGHSSIASGAGILAVVYFDDGGTIVNGALLLQNEPMREQQPIRNPVGSHTSVDEHGNVTTTFHWPDGSTDIVVRDRKGRVVSRHGHSGPCVPGGVCPAAAAQAEAEAAEEDDPPAADWAPGEWEDFEAWVESIEAAEAAAGGP